MFLNMNEMNLSESMRRNILGAHGARGDEWLRALPRLLQRIRSAWGLHDIEPFSNLTYNFVAKARNESGTDVVLKLGVITSELSSEMRALELFEGRGVARLLRALPEEGAFLLERVDPGTPLGRSIDDSGAIEIASAMIRRMHVSIGADPALPSLARWSRSLREADAATSPLPRDLLVDAQRVLSELLGSTKESVLLHGDLHHDNILRAADGGWAVIDPKGLTGDPTYEVTTFLLNPPGFAEESGIRDKLALRIDRFAAELGFDRGRMTAWTYVQAMLSACWHVEDSSDGWRGNVRCAEALREIGW